MVKVRCAGITAFGGLLLAAAMGGAQGGAVRLDFNTDGALPNQEDTQLTRVTDQNHSAQNANYDEVAGGYWHGDFREGDQSNPAHSPRYRYYYGTHPELAAPSGALSINFRLRFLAPVAPDAQPDGPGYQGADRDLYFNVRNGAGLLLVLFNYYTPEGSSEMLNQIGALQLNGSQAYRDTGASFADFHNYAITWDGTFGSSRPANLYIDGNFIGTTYAFNGGANANGYTEFGDGNTPDGTIWQVDWLRFGNDQVVLAPKWNADDDGNWSVESNWLDGVPNAVGATANFTDAISAAHTVTVDAPQTIGRIKFDNANAYTVAGTSTLTMDVTAGAASITVLSGSHTISAPIAFARNTTIDAAAAASTLTLSGQLSSAAGVTLTKAGPGTVRVSVVRADGLVVRAGSLAVLAGATANDASGTSVVKTLAIDGGPAAPTATVDLANNSMVIDYTGAVGTLVDDTRQLLKAGADTGLGIVSSSADADKRLGYADNAALGLTTFAGQTVDADSVLIKYTYAGDTNLDGQVDVIDLGNLATAWQTNANWNGGDSNYDGVVDVIDLGMLATEWQAGVGSPLGPGSLQEALAGYGLPNVAVPEPCAIGLVGAMVALLAGRKRR